jgi:hypothetical protein
LCSWANRIQIGAVDEINDLIDSAQLVDLHVLAYIPSSMLFHQALPTEPLSILSASTFDFGSTA